MDPTLKAITERLIKFFKLVAQLGPMAVAGAVVGLVVGILYPVIAVQFVDTDKNPSGAAVYGFLWFITPPLFMGIGAAAGAVSQMVVMIYQYFKGGNDG